MVAAVPPSIDSQVAAALAGDKEAWDALVRDHADVVWSIIRVLGIQEPNASDVFQIVFLRLTENLAKIDPPALRAWLRTVTRRCCYDVSRQRQRNPIPSDHLTESAATWQPTIEEIAVQADDQQAVLRGLARLSAACQRLLRLISANAEFSYQEISELLDMPIGSIGPTRARCLEQLARTAEVRALNLEKGG